MIPLDMFDSRLKIVLLWVLLSYFLIFGEREEKVKTDD